VSSASAIETEMSTDRQRSIFTTQQEARNLERRLIVCPSQKTANAALRRACFLLHTLAQKHVPNTPANFDDYSTLLAATNILLELGLKPPIDTKLRQGINRLGDDIVINSFQYRHLKNKTIASLSVIADLAEKAASNGSADFRRGMREAFQRASDLAVAFLEEISTDFEAAVDHDE